MRIKKLLLLILLAVAIFASGCSINFNTGGTSSTANTSDGGLFRSDDKGVNWKQKTAIPTVSGKPSSFGSYDAYALAIDPSDHKTIYLAAIAQGLLYSYNNGETWQRNTALNDATFLSVAVDPVSKCVIYGAVGNKLYKTTDCTRSWSQVYFDNDLNVKINDVVIDSTDSKTIYLGNSRGDIIRSSDSGESWQTINRFSNAKIVKIVISPTDKNIIFAASDKKGLYRTNDRGVTWTSLAVNLKAFKDSSNFKDLVFSGVNPGTLFLASNYGILKSDNNGDSWTALNLITPIDKATINALAVSPKNDDEMYYVTNTTFYKSVDGGTNWTVKKLPSSRSGWLLAVDPESPGTIYLGVRIIQK